MNGKKKAVIAGIAVAIAAAVIGIFLSQNGGKEDLTATTMRILSYTGIVSLEDNGKDSTLREDMMLHNGNVLSTKEESYVDINLDDTKAAGLDQDSLAAFVQDGKKLQIDLNEGGLYFFTTKKLDDDETFEIKTQSMMVGIRGTSGYVKDKKAGKGAKVFLTSGQLKGIEIKNLTTGATKSVNMAAGQMLNVSFDNSKKGINSIKTETKNMKPKDVPGLLALRLAEHPKVLNEVKIESGLSKKGIVSNALDFVKNNPTALSNEKGLTPHPTLESGQKEQSGGNNSGNGATTNGDQQNGNGQQTEQQQNGENQQQNGGQTTDQTNQQQTTQQSGQDNGQQTNQDGQDSGQQTQGEGTQQNQPDQQTDGQGEQTNQQGEGDKKKSSDTKNEKNNSEKDSDNLNNSNNESGYKDNNISNNNESNADNSSQQNTDSLRDSISSTTGQNGTTSNVSNNSSETTAGSDDKGTSGSSATVTKIVIDVDSVSLSPGKSKQITATVTYSDGTTNGNVNWASGNEEVATIDSLGRINAVKSGVAVITATAKDDASKSASVNVTVGEGSDVTIVLKEHSKTVNVGEEFFIYYTMTNSDNLTEAETKMGATWSTSDATIVSVEQNGLCKALKVGRATVTLTSNYDNNVKDSCVVTVEEVSAEKTVNRVEINSDDLTLVTGEERSLTATVRYSDGTTGSGVNWSTSNESAVSVDSSGRINALAEGTARITAKAKDDSSKTASIEVTVASGGDDTDSVAGIELDESLRTGFSDNIGGSYQARATVTYSSGRSVENSDKVEWVSSDISVATVNSSGLISFVGVGRVKITATSTENSSVKAVSSKIKVNNDSNYITSILCTVNDSPGDNRVSLESIEEEFINVEFEAQVNNPLVQYELRWDLSSLSGFEVIPGSDERYQIVQITKNANIGEYPVSVDVLVDGQVVSIADTTLIIE